MVSDETLLSYPNWIISFTVHTYVSEKQLFDVISQNNNPKSFFSKILSNPKHNYTATEKKMLIIVELPK